MNLTAIQFILSNLEARGKLRELEERRFRGMTPEEVRERKRASRRACYAARRFLDLEAEESEGEVESCLSAEDGFAEVVGGSRPLDSEGKPFVRFVGKRLVKVLSSEYFDLSEGERCEVKRLERLHNDVNKFC